MGIVTKCYLGVNNVARLIYENSSPTPPTPTSYAWSDASDADILSMVTAAYQGTMDLTNYWHVGDVRNVSFKAMSDSYVGESHTAQTIPIVLTHVGGRKLADGTTNCKFQWAMKTPMAESGYMNSTASNTGGWNSCARRSWCNNIFKDSCVSNDMNSVLFRQAQYLAGKGGGVKELQTSTDYCSLLAVAEINPNMIAQGSAITVGEGTQLDYYKTASNIPIGAYTRSPASYSSTNGFCYIYSTTQAMFVNGNVNEKILVCGVI